MDLAALKSGTDLRGVAIAGKDPVTLTDEAAAAAAAGFVLYLRAHRAHTERKRLKIALGHDSRLSADRLTSAVLGVLKRAGCEILCCGLCSTPAMFMMTVLPETDCDGAVMITASHHPYDKNGLKFFLKSGGVNAAQLDEIIALGSRGGSVTGGKPIVRNEDFLELYCAYLRSKFTAAGGDKPLAGLKIAVDAGNGAGGFFAERVLAPLGADISASQFLEPDGHFPNHSPNPENAEAMQSLADRVKETGADLGVIFDTDADRAAFVSSDGTEINRNRLIALVSAIVLDECPGGAIVTDSVTSDGLKTFIENHGGIHHRYKRGYRNVIDEAIRLERSGIAAPLAIETSGHAALKENYYLDDGAYLAVRIITKTAQLKKLGLDLSSLITDLRMPAEAKEIRLTFSCADWRAYGDFVIRSLKTACEKLKGDFVRPAPVDYEGVRVNLSAADGWFLVRMSVHDPIMVINMEADRPGGTVTLAKFLYAYLSQFTELDASPLRVPGE